MASSHWGSDTDPNYELWDELCWHVAQWICQRREQQGPERLNWTHIANPFDDNTPCDCCYDRGYWLVRDGLRQLLQVYGSVAYSCGRTGVPERRAVRRALRRMIERANEMEGVKELLAEVAGKDGWFKSALEDDERRAPPFSDEEQWDSSAS